MTTIRIGDAQPGEAKAIQAIVNRHGFGPLAVDNGDLVSINPDDLKGFEQADLEQELLDDVGKHLAISFR